MEDSKHSRATPVTRLCIFKKFTYGLFKIIYSEIKGFETTETNINTKTLKSQIGKNFKYNVALEYYTDTMIQ